MSEQYKNAQTWLNMLEKRAEEMTEAQKKGTEPTPRLIGGLSGEYINVSGAIQRLRDLCMALEQSQSHHVIFQSDA